LSKIDLNSSQFTQDLKANLLKLQSELQILLTTKPQTTTPNQTSKQALPPEQSILSSNNKQPAPLPGNTPTPQKTATPNIPNQIELTTLSSELLKQVSSSLARINLNQLNVITLQLDQIPAWQLEIPIRHNDGVHMLQVLIEKEVDDHPPQDENAENNSADPEHRWQVTLAFDLPNLGPMQAQIAIETQSLNITFLAEEEATKEYIANELPSLKQQLEAEGLVVSDLQSLHGTLPERQNRYITHLLDIEV